MASYELKNTQILGGHEAREVSSHDRDDLHLQRLGKAPVLKVGICRVIRTTWTSLLNLITAQFRSPLDFGL